MANPVAGHEPGQRAAAAEREARRAAPGEVLSRRLHSSGDRRGALKISAPGSRVRWFVFDKPVGNSCGCSWVAASISVIPRGKPRSDEVLVQPSTLRGQSATYWLDLSEIKNPDIQLHGKTHPNVQKLVLSFANLKG